MNEFKGRHFSGEVVLWAVRWYCRYGISYRDLETMMAERGVCVDHSTIYRWVQKYAPEMERRMRWQWRRPMPSPSAEFGDQILDSIVYDYLSSIGAQECPNVSPLERHKIKQILQSKDGSIRQMQQAYAALLRKKALQEILPAQHHERSKASNLVHLPSPSEAFH